MAITKTWEINTMERDLSDGYVTKVIYRVKGISDSEEKARKTGSVVFIKPDSLPSDFVDFTKLDAATVLGWVKDTLNADEANGVATIESELEAEVNEVLTPTTASGVPW
tara:strand:- start:122 stop:448 length:327 start_codon:yes stop_codon:yes gene_type:complete